MRKISDLPAVLLVGGMGTRLRFLFPATPKPLVSVGKRSFLELLIRQLRFQGISRVVMCAGYLAEQIENEFGDGRQWNMAIEYSKESVPMGTAGALKLAENRLSDASDFLVMNGDSFLEADFGKLFELHRRRGTGATMAAVHVENASRYGTVSVDSEGRVVRFLEKTGNSLPGLINAGVYVFNRAIFDHIPNAPASLEKDIFPQLIKQGVHALTQRGMFIDIGTPEEYARAQELCDQLYTAALPKLPQVFEPRMREVR